MHDWFREFQFKGIKNKWEVQYLHHLTDGPPHLSHLSLKQVFQPFSIKLVEFEFIRTFVEKHQLERGFEVATGTGISCIAAGMGMKDRSTLVTMDAYIEENRRDSMSYIGESKVTYTDAYGYKSAIQLIEAYNLDATVFPTVGWSPDDTSKVVESYFTEPLQYVFIDALHTTDAVLEDLKAIAPYIDQTKYAIFLHDTHAFDARLHEYLKSTYGKTYEVCPGCSFEEGAFNLSLVTNL